MGSPAGGDARPPDGAGRGGPHARCGDHATGSVGDLAGGRDGDPPGGDAAGDAEVACPVAGDAALTGEDVTLDEAARRRHMDAAFAAAREALRHQEVPVGCVMVRAGRVVATGRNTVNATKNATRHAELNCVDAIYRQCSAAGVPAAAVWGATDVFVTVEPCVMCAAALVQLGVRSVRYGCANQRFGGCGSVLSVPGQLLPTDATFVQDAERVDEAIALLKAFYKGDNPNAPRAE